MYLWLNYLLDIIVLKLRYFNYKINFNMNYTKKALLNANQSNSDSNWLE